MWCPYSGRNTSASTLEPCYLLEVEPLVAGEAAAHRGRLIALSVEATANERIGLEGRDDPSWMAARVGGAEAAPIRSETTLCANATLALGAAEPEVGACCERRVEVTHQVRAERCRHEPFTQFVLEGWKRLATALGPTAAVR